MVNFAIVKFDNFCKNELIAVQFKRFDGKHSKIVFFFQIKTISEYVYLDVQWYRYGNKQGDCLLTL